MIPISDYHMHTPLCGHAVGEPHEYVEQALKVGLQEIGFSDHAPLISHEDPKITMSFRQLPEYHRMIEDVRTRYRGKLGIKVALEADFLVGYEEKTRAMLQAYPYDYVIGSVHFIKQWGFDNPDEQDQWKSKDINQIYRFYYALLRQSAESKLFDIMGHVDLVKKFGHRSSEDMTDEITQTAQVFKKTGVAVEINTAGLRKPVKEIYPSLHALKIYCRAGVPLTFGSDAHDPQDVGRDFSKGVELAKAAGYQEYILFKQRKIERSVKL
jgi:histidinol-phosphatase (PHP family)